MLVTFNIILFIFILLFGLSSLGEKDENKAFNYALVLVFCIGIQALLFLVG